MRGDDTGSAAVWWVSCCLVSWFLVHTVLTIAAVRLERDRAGTAADLAALSAAARAHQGTEAACAVARETARANGADLDECAVDVHTVTVTVELPSTVLPRTLRARSRAGPAHLLEVETEGVASSSAASLPPHP